MSHELFFAYSQDKALNGTFFLVRFTVQSLKKIIFKILKISHRNESEKGLKVSHLFEWPINY